MTRGIRYLYDPQGQLTNDGSRESCSSMVCGFPAVIVDDRPAAMGRFRENGEHVIVPGIYERDLIDWVIESVTIASGMDQFVDCGAHTGSWTLLMANHFRQVHAFEPQRLVFQRLCGNIALNGLENVYAHNVGLDHFRGSLSLQRFGEDRGSATARPDLWTKFHEHPELSTSETVEVIALDDFNELPGPFSLDRVGLMKIDVEGYELQVLKGAVQTLKLCGLPKLLIECWAHDWYREEKAQLVAFLEDLGYRVVPLHRYDDMLLAEKE